MPLLDIRTVIKPAIEQPGFQDFLKAASDTLQSGGYAVPCSNIRTVSSDLYTATHSGGLESHLSLSLTPHSWDIREVVPDLLDAVRIVQELSDVTHLCFSADDPRKRTKGVVVFNDVGSATEYVFSLFLLKKWPPNEAGNMQSFFKKVWLNTESLFDEFGAAKHVQALSKAA